MKKILLLIVFTAFITGAETINTQELAKTDSTGIVRDSSIAADSVNIRQLVQSQFDNAKHDVVKSSFNFQVPVKVNEAPVKAEPKKKEGFENLVSFLIDINSRYTNAVIFVFATILILGFLFGRRFLKVIFSKSKKDLKRRINLIRDEQPIFKTNKKLRLARTKLADSTNILAGDENLLNSTAKEMRLGKGELLLAAKIKAFQLSKISR